jgi:hypothetical protein
MTKISALSDIGTSVASNDTFVLVDASDPTTPNKKIQHQNFFLIPDGSAATPGLRFLNDTDTGIYRPGANQLAISTNGTGRLFVDSSGNVGVNNASPSVALDVDGQIRLTNDLLIADATATRGRVYGDSSGAVFRAETGLSARFHIGSAEVGRFDSSGRLGIGTTSPDAALQITKTSAGSDPIHLLLSNGSASAGTTSSIYFAPNVVGSIRAAAIKGVNEDGGNSTALTFFTNSEGNAPTERARIDSSGRLLFGTSSYAQNIAAAFKGYAGASTQPGRIALLRQYSAISGNNLDAEIATINFADDNGDGDGARIRAEIDGTSWSTTSKPTRLVFSVTADGASSPTEAMRIKNSRILNFANTPVYADNAAAKTGGLVDGDVYRTSTGDLKIVYT